VEAAYVFRVRFRLDPDEVCVSPATFETVVEWPAPEPGTDGWLRFRELCWRGEASDPGYLRDLLGDRLGVSVVEASFSELRTDAAYLEAWEAAVADSLDAFNADSVREVRHRFFGSSVRVVDD
jgi:hypothetical protein